MNKINTLTISQENSLAFLWERVLHEAIKIKQNKGYILKKRNETEDRLYFLQSGNVSLINISTNGKECLIGRAKGPALLCEENIFSRSTHLDTYIILNTACTLYAFTKTWVYNTLLPQYPKLTQTILQSLAEKTTKLINHRVLFNSGNISNLVCTFLHQHTHIKEGKIYAKTQLNQAELASFLDVHPVTLSKVLKNLQNEGIISKYHKHETTIIDNERLLYFCKTQEN